MKLWDRLTGKHEREEEKRLYSERLYRTLTGPDREPVPDDPDPVRVAETQAELEAELERRRAGDKRKKALIEMTRVLIWLKRHTRG